MDLEFTHEMPYMRVVFGCSPRRMWYVWEQVLLDQLCKHATANVNATAFNKLRLLREVQCSAG